MHINARNIVALFKASVAGLIPSPNDAMRLRFERALARRQRYWKRNTSYPYSSTRQHERYARNQMDVQQRNSHKPGTLQPRHIFGAAA